VRLVTFLVPAHNERENLPVLLGEIRAAAARAGAPYEILVVDDGSDDGTGEWLVEEAARVRDLRAIRSGRNRGQSAALAAGLRDARGDVVVTMDADLQNDPADVPAMLEALRGCDLVCGVRRKRKDTLRKRVASRFANWLRRITLGDRFEDVGCSLKVWRRAVAEEVPKFQGFHRYIPIFAEALGFKVVEVPVRHRPRVHGRTHYGNLSRALRGLRDLFGVAWLLARRIPLDPPPGAPLPSPEARRP
jgi:dolichol-phosphate mannosyltransferase